MTGSLTSELHSTNGFNWYDEITKEWKKSVKSTSATTNDKEKITTIESNYYYYYPETLTETSDSSATIGIAQSNVAYNLLFNDTSDKRYWIKSHFVCEFSYYAVSGLRIVNGDNVNDVHSGTGTNEPF